MIIKIKTSYFRSIFFFVIVRSLTAQNLTILHTNDLHAQYLPLKSGKSPTGGMEALDALVRRESNGRTLLLDAGDFQTGTLVSRLNENGVTGGGMVAMMNLLGFRASVPGNHEFDEGSQNLKRMEAMADFDLLAANLEKDGRPFLEKTHTVATVGGIRVGIIGLVSGKMDKLVPAEKRDRDGNRGSRRRGPAAHPSPRFNDGPDRPADASGVPRRQPAGVRRA